MTEGLKRVMISILPLFLLLGVVTSKHISYYDNFTKNEPIITELQERRICAELCMSGLGGEPCGDDCGELTPQGIPIRSQSKNGTYTERVVARDGVCTSLCDNYLGYPLCKCNYNYTKMEPFFKINYFEICFKFCDLYNYQLYGCETCDVYKNAEKNPINGFIYDLSKKIKEVDWNAWCQQMCQEGEGGAACYCDLLPMSA